MIPALTQNATDQWLTPLHVIEALGKFDLDPCAHPVMPTRIAERGYSLPQHDGLLMPWEGRIFVNPPYGRQIDKWVERSLLHGNGIMLMFTRTETAWHRLLWENASAILFLYERLYFVRPDGSDGRAPMGSALFAIGKENAKALVEAKRELPGALVWGVNA